MQSKAREAAVLAEVGEGGFGAQDLELTQQFGALSWVRVCALYFYEPTMYTLRQRLIVPCHTAREWSTSLVLERFSLAHNGSRSWQCLLPAMLRDSLTTGVMLE